MNQAALDEKRIAQIREIFTRVPYAHFIGLELGEIKSGEATIHLKVRDDFKQNQGVVHGGVIASVIDTASAFAVVTQLEQGERVTTTDLTIHYLRPVTKGEIRAAGPNCTQRPAPVRHFCGSLGQSTSPNCHSGDRLYKAEINRAT